ncbi:hypothetical protein F4781DRAFT_383054 [Annulohypoxylon bovei var. microspora]|nr:hypothetical protein F4781DRAFT_383054 [Annulohypoxylon bovei var. microspora]
MLQLPMYKRPVFRFQLTSRQLTNPNTTTCKPHTINSPAYRLRPALRTANRPQVIVESPHAFMFPGGMRNMSDKQQPQQQQQQQPRQVSRQLVKGRLQPPSKPTFTKSYTVARASIHEVTVRHPSEGQTTQGPVEISSAATAQPFVDPAVLERHRRIGGPT